MQVVFYLPTKWQHIYEADRDPLEKATEEWPVQNLVVCSLVLIWRALWAKRLSRYVPERIRAAWYKIKNPNYTQTDGRSEMFEELRG